MRSRPATSRSASGPPKSKCHSAGQRTMESQGGIPGTARPSRRASRSFQGSAPLGVGDHRADIVPNDRSPVEAERRQDGADVGGLRALVVAAGCPTRVPCAKVGHDNRWSRARSAASGAHMSPVSPNPCSSTTAGPWLRRGREASHPSVWIFCVRTRLESCTCAATGNARRLRRAYLEPT